MITQHQFYEKDFFVPDWEVKHLFLGTFNPSLGTEVSYFYGREKNNFWKRISMIFKDKFKPNENDFFQKLKIHNIACMDIINQIEYDKLLKNDIEGNGYKDSTLFLNSVNKVYNTDNIISVIKKNNLKKVYFTRKPNGFRKEQIKLIDEISIHAKVVYLSSPSPMAKIRGNNNDSDWEIILK